MIAETSQEDGSKAQIVFRTNAHVEARDLEMLCTKVCWEVGRSQIIRQRGITVGIHQSHQPQSHGEHEESPGP